MMRFEGDPVIRQFEEAFGIKGDEMTPAQLIWIIKVIKHCRGRCRSNAALHNYLKRTFTGLSFREVPREFKGKRYLALEITNLLKDPKGSAVVEDEGESDS